MDQASGFSRGVVLALGGGLLAATAVLGGAQDASAACKSYDLNSLYMACKVSYGSKPTPKYCTKKVKIVGLRSWVGYKMVCP